MLQLIREHAQGLVVWTIVGLIIVTFALFGLSSYLSGSSTNAVATVNGDEIKRDDFQRAYRNYQDRLRQLLGENYRPDLFSAERMKQEVINGLVNQYLLTQYFEKQGLYPANQLVAEEIRGIPAFQDESGQFSSERYQQVIIRQGFSPQMFEADISREIAGRQFSQALQKTAFVTPYEFELYNQLKNQQRDIGYLLFAKSGYLKEAKADDETIEKYYQEHQAEFTTPERVKLSYVELNLSKRAEGHSVSDSEIEAYYQEHRESYLKQAEQRKARHILITVGKDVDDATARSKLEQVLTEYKSGKDFADLAKQYSEDPGSAQQGGDLGFFGRGIMDQSFEAVAFALPKGQVSEPVKSRFGYHLILVDDIKPAEYQSLKEVKDSIKRTLQIQQTEQTFYADAEKFDNLAYDVPDSLEPIANELGLEIRQTDFLTRNGGQGLFANPKLIEAAFSDEVLSQGRNSNVIEISDTHLIVLRLAEHQPPSQKSLQEVEPQIEFVLRDQTAREQARQDAKTALTAFTSDTAIEDIANQNSKAKWQRVGFIGRVAGQDPAADKPTADARKGLSREVRQKAFQMPHPQSDKPSSDMTELANGDIAIVLVYKVRAGEANKSESTMTVAQPQLRAALGNADYEGLLQQLRAEADISIQLENTEDQ